MRSFQKNARNILFFSKERKRMQGMIRSFQKYAKECKNVAFFWKERMPIAQPCFWHTLYYIIIQIFEKNETKLAVLIWLLNLLASYFKIIDIIF